MVDRIDRSTNSRPISRYLPRVALTDVVVHHLDIARPLGVTSEVGKNALRFALAHPDPFARPRRYTRGLRFEAADLGWSSGRGPIVRGPAGSLALAVVGRGAAVDELEGDGLEELRRRMAAAATA